MFLAIISDTYAEVKAEPLEDLFHLKQFFKGQYNALVRKLFPNCSQKYLFKEPTAFVADHTKPSNTVHGVGYNL